MYVKNCMKSFLQCSCLDESTRNRFSRIMRTALQTETRYLTLWLWTNDQTFLFGGVRAQFGPCNSQLDKAWLDSLNDVVFVARWYSTIPLTYNGSDRVTPAKGRGWHCHLVWIASQGHPNHSSNQNEIWRDVLEGLCVTVTLSSYVPRHESPRRISVELRRATSTTARV